jgi:hypothetical protein
MGMTIELKPEQERILQEALRQGRFQTLAQVRHQTDETKPNPLKTGSGDGRVCTTFAVGLEMFWKADAKLP